MRQMTTTITETMPKKTKKEWTEIKTGITKKRKCRLE